MWLEVMFDFNILLGKWIYIFLKNFSIYLSNSVYFVLYYILIYNMYMIRLYVIFYLIYFKV